MLSCEEEDTCSTCQAVLHEHQPRPGPFFFLNIPSRDCGNLKSQCPIVFPRCMSYEEEDTCSALLYFLE
jgi:hypothetical protein